MEMCPEQVNQGDERPHGQDLRRTAEVTCFVQLEEEEAEGGLIATLKGGSGRAGVDLLSLETSGRIQENRMKLRGSSYVTLGKGSFLSGSSATGG